MSPCHIAVFVAWQGKKGAIHGRVALFLQRGKAVQNCPRVGRAAGDKQVNGQQVGDALVALIAAAKQPARNGARAHSYHKARLWHGLVGIQHGEAHVFRNRAGHGNAICMAGRGHKVDAKAPKIKHQSCQYVAVGLAGIAASGADLPQLERTAEQ